MKKLLFFFLHACASVVAAEVSEPKVTIPLWPEGVPNARSDLPPERLEDGRVYSVSNPTLTMYAPPAGKANGTAIIVCPGGGYARLSVGGEGNYANFFNNFGVVVYVLKYRMWEFGHPAPLQDILRAVRLVRDGASKYGIKPDRIGVLGASAGGHVAASAGTLFDSLEGKTGHPLDAISGRPDFLMLLYPVITMDGPATHAGSRKNLLGAAPTPALVQRMSLEKQVSDKTPPTFLMHTQVDETVTVDNSILFYQALTKHRVPAEMHLFEQGAHGVGMKKGLGPTSNWPQRAEEWLRDRKLIQ